MIEVRLKFRRLEYIRSLVFSLLFANQAVRKKRYVLENTRSDLLDRLFDSFPPCEPEIKQRDTEKSSTR